MDLIFFWKLDDIDHRQTRKYRVSFLVYDTYRRLNKKYQVLLMQTRIFYDYLRTRISEPKSA